MNFSEIDPDIILNPILYTSLAFGILAAAFVMISSYVLNLKSAQRMSFKLSGFVAILDIIFSLTQTVNIDRSTVYCKFLYGLVYSTIIMYSYIATGIAYNLKTVFVDRSPKSYLGVKFYLMISATISLVVFSILVAIGWTTGGCSFNKFNQICSIILYILIIWALQFINILYCLYSITLVIIKLWSLRIVNNEHQDKQMNEYIIMKSTNTKINRVVRRIIFYPILPIIMYMPYLLFVILMAFGEDFMKFYWLYIPCFSCGTLNFIVLLLDPAIPKIIMEMKSKNKFHLAQIKLFSRKLEPKMANNSDYKQIIINTKGNKQDISN